MTRHWQCDLCGVEIDVGDDKRVPEPLRNALLERLIAEHECSTVALNERAGAS